MQINGSRILVLGGWGLVGSAICRKLMEHDPAKLFVSSLRKEEAEDAITELRKEFPGHNPDIFEARWGNIFTRTEWKDISWMDVINDKNKRKGVVADVFNELDEEIVNKSALYELIKDTKPDLVIDCINTATAIAYLNIYDTVNEAKRRINEGSLDEELIERLMSSIYIPQLIRHIQLLYHGLTNVKSTMYLKIGTSGTGGMGLNIPYTHSEERPSRVLLSKTAVAGAQTLLNFLMARTPGGLIAKEIKPAAAIAWKRIAYDTIKKGGKPIRLVDMKPEDAHDVDGKFRFDDNKGVKDLGSDFKSVFIDTGENGIFSKGEFTAIGSLGQMEIVTPEEIASYAVFEITGGNTGKDVIQGLDAFCLGPTYRGGMLYKEAVNKIAKLEEEHDANSIAFELLGPPRLSKLLYEANIIKKIAGSMNDAVFYKPNDMANEAAKLINSDEKLRSQIISIGLVILMPDGKKFIRGNTVKIPKKTNGNEVNINEKTIDKWCFEGWIDLRPSNFEKWNERFNEIIKQAESVTDKDTSSRFTYTKDYWNGFETIDEGKVAGWIFEFEDKGWRFKR